MRNVNQTFTSAGGRLALSVILVSLLAGSVACAGEPSKKSRSKKAKPVPVVQMEPMVVTGSAIPQKVGKLGRTQPLASNVAVIDQAAIRNSGSATLVGVLRMNQAANWRR